MVRSLSRKVAEEGQYTRIPGYPLYEIDRFANLRRIYKTKRVPLKPTLKRGRYVVRLMDEKGRQEIPVHKLMQITFLPRPVPGQVLYHKNQVLTDNALSNLAYIDRHTLGQMTGAKSRRRPVAKINQNGETVEVYRSAREAARQNYMSYQTVMDRCNGKIKSPHALDGYRYEWDDKEDEGV